MNNLAKDGKPFDIDEIGELKKGEIEVIQYVRPNGKRRRMACEVGEDLAKQAEGLVISADIKAGVVFFYVRKIGQEPEEEHIYLATNFPSKIDTVKTLKRIIHTHGGT
jgi:hypothetical protein